MTPAELTQQKLATKRAGRESAEQRAAQLAERLQELGVEPDEL